MPRSAHLCKLKVDRLNRVGKRVAALYQHRGPVRRRRGTGGARELNLIHHEPGRAGRRRDGKMSAFRT
jgi:hypothetical protein